MADQFRADCLGADGNRVIRTPNLDHLSNDAENFGGLMTEVHICNSVTSSTYGNQCN